MFNIVYLPTPANFNFKHTLRSHGWSELKPFELDEERWKLNYVFADESSEKAESAAIFEENGALRIELSKGVINHNKIIADVKHILRLDDDLSSFYSVLKKDPNLSWLSTQNAGRLLRSPTVFEDLVKTLCTTNCSWALTRKMVTNIVEKLGVPAGDGKYSFPTPKALASVSADFFREEIRAGYRSEYFVEMAEKIASGKLDPEKWLTSELPTAELKKEIKTIKGFGDYASENLLKLLGRYDGLALDSWLRAGFYKKHNGEKLCKDSKIEKHYKKFGEWKGLAMWCDMTGDRSS